MCIRDSYSSIRAGLLEFRRRCEAIQHGVIVHQLCRPIWRAWMEQALLEGALALPQFTEKKRDYFAAKWIPQGWQWVDPKKEFDAMLTAIRAGLLSRSEAISAFGYEMCIRDRDRVTHCPKNNQSLKTFMSFGGGPFVVWRECAYARWGLNSRAACVRWPACYPGTLPPYRNGFAFRMWYACTAGHFPPRRKPIRRLAGAVFFFRVGGACLCGQLDGPKLSRFPRS